MQTTAFDELDLQLLHGLQIAPRVPWAQAARILGTSPVTLMQRWDRLRREGLAWVVTHPSGEGGGVLTAFVEVDLEPGRHAGALAALMRDPRALSIEQSARGRDLLVTVMARDLTALGGYLLDELPALPGVQRQRTSLALQIHRQGRDWRLQSLDQAQREGFASARRQTPPGPATMPRDPGPIIEALVADGRVGAAEIARATGRNPATVRRHLARVIATGELAFRCEIAQDPTLWALHCTWFARVPEEAKERTVAALTTLPELRLCVSTTGESNLLVSVWARSPSDLMRLERLLADRLPWLALVESVVMLRTLKRFGWLVDDRGRATGEVVAPVVIGDERRPGA
ncbi:AsnC family transcriptional regulator [Janibacter sp. LM]|uniref:Lrp/AsnC family transcriptional regulator n=1 Tax=Janibacter TaxID=53457 RepID=UPI000E9B3652|nr:Lrp/AsnC family transcriptional regulator [Janibacter terrae]